MRASIDLDSAAARRQILLRPLPGSILQRGPKGWIGSDQERGSSDPGEQWKQVTLLACLVKDADHRLSTHFVQCVDLALNIGLRPARTACSDFGSQFLWRTTNVPGIGDRSFFGITTTKVISRVLQDQMREVGYRLLGPGSACQHDRCRSTPGVPDQRGMFQTQGFYKRNRVIGGTAQAICSSLGLDALAMPAHIEGVDPVAIRQTWSNTHPALCRTRNAVQQQHAGEF